MSFEAICERLQEREVGILRAVRASSERLLNHTPRFRFFTLHGTEHLNSLYEIFEILLEGHVELSRDEIFLLALAICIHDLGMVVTLRDKDLGEILEGKPAFPDPASFENYVRQNHHDLVEEYTNQHFGFLTDLGLSPMQVAQIVDISRCHRKVDLDAQFGVTKYLGALLRIIDELDVSARRAPADVLINNFDSMDPISCWHWFKHNITESWAVDHTVQFVEKNGRRSILFQLIARPPRQQSIGYWLNQIHRPLKKALYDDGAQRIVKDKFGIEVDVIVDPELSTVGTRNPLWIQIEERALSQNRKVVLVIDDEFRKFEELFWPVMDHFHVIPAPHARDALEKLAAAHVDLAIVDMQIGSGGLWTAAETQDFKTTGVKVCETIVADFPKTKIGILTGTKHPIPPLDHLPIVFNMRKPVDPKALLARVQYVLA
jgi:hypothetical protein